MHRHPHQNTPEQNKSLANHLTPSVDSKPISQLKDTREERKKQESIQALADQTASLRQAPFIQQKHSGALVAQTKLIIGGKEYTKRGAKVTKQLKEALKSSFGAAKWKRGWVKKLEEMVVSKEKEYKFSNPGEFAKYLMNLYPPKVASSPEADLLKSAFAEAGSLSITGFIWKVVSDGFTLKDGRSFTKTDLLKALQTKGGRELVDAAWRDKSGGKRVGQTIQGQHEWILTSDIRYVIANAKGMDDLATWFMAAEILRSPTKNVIFEVLLTKEQMKLVKSGKIGTFAELGALSAHAGGIYEERKDNDPKKKDAKKHNVQAATGSSTFHTNLHKLLTQYLNDKKSDLPGFLKALMMFQQKKVWSGKIKGVKPEEVKGVKPGFYTGAHKSSPEVSSNMQKFMQLQQKRNELDLEIMKNRVNAIMTEVKRLQTSKENWVYKLNSLDDDIRVDVMAAWEDLDTAFEESLKKMDKKYKEMKAKIKDENKLKGLDFTFQKMVSKNREKVHQQRMEVLDKVYKKLMGT